MKKFLYAEKLVFILPDDFDGNLTEALEELVKYRKTNIAKENRRKDKLKEPTKSMENSIEIIESNDTRLCCNFGFGILDDDKKVHPMNNNELID